MRNEKIFDSLAWQLHKLGVRPDHITYLQTLPLAGLVWAGYYGHLFWFGTFQILVIIVDGADGILARRTGTTSRRGHLLDSIFDILGIGITLWAVAHLRPEYAQWALGLLMVNFLVYIQNEIQGTKSVTYTRGPVTVGLYLDQWFLYVLPAGLIVPFAYGLVLMVSRVEWRKRLWNWYQFFTAGRRREYKATPRTERAGLSHPPGSTPPKPRGGPEEKPPRSGEQT